MESEADIAAVAAVLASRARTAMLDLLMDGLAHPAGDLARAAGVALSTASGHLAALTEAGLVILEPVGRQRRFRLARPEVARALEALAVVAPRRPVSSLRAATAAGHLRDGRTCYDHLAGRLGVAVTNALVSRRALRSRDGAFVLTGPGERLFRSVGVDVERARNRRRGFALQCQDWTERRRHLAGALGAELCGRLFELRWVARRGRGRAVVLTRAGSQGLRSLLGIELSPADWGNRVERPGTDRFAGLRTGEPFPARGVVLVEGLSDQLALEALAERRGRNLDSEGIAIVPMGGSKNIRRFLGLFGPQGFDVRLAGLCDAAEEGDFRRALQRAGLGSDLTRAEMESLGFFVCDADLEDELIRSLGAASVEQIVDAQGELGSFRTFQKQPAQQGRTPGAQLRRFMGTRGGRKAQYAPLLVDALDLNQVPRPLDGVLAHV